ncbi:elongation factor Ts, mitochondrial [Sitophilus oryzae]|uniref:Elongation factor Ts, mitochondrial n=1 Tax=Sitophilus oryzae TaxID=7048 RepID=A0A6J2YCU1_SITOR|nr:elongation factor Ts, mitochondrial [Sitophilus oryzae]
MIVLRNLTRYFHSSASCTAVEKSALASLRKKTGYTFANCKKALEMHHNDLNKAESWLKEQAQTLGWSKATKLGGRQTSQGLIGVYVDNNDGVLVEVNCETDFVARNQEFEDMVREATEACMKYAKSSPKSPNAVTKIGLDSEQFRALKTKDDKTLADKLALVIGSVGENATLKRAVCLKVNNDVSLEGYAHPSGKSRNNVLLGRLGGIVAIKSQNNSQENLEEIAKGLCQHVVGMAPKRIGNPEGEPAENKDEEDCLIFQEYLLEDGVKIKDFLEENQVEVVDFKRFECGETLEVVGDQPLELLETCQ